MTSTTISTDPAVVDAEFARIVDELTRRGFLAGGLGAAALLGLAACGSSAGSTDRPAAGPWSFVDDLGHTVNLPARPTRVAVLGDPLGASLWAAGLHVVASPMELKDAYSSIGLSTSQIDGIVNIGAADQSYNTEALLEAHPDIIVGNADTTKIFALNIQPGLAKVAPMVGLNQQTRPFDDIMTSIHRLAASMGVNPADKDTEQDYHAQAEALRTALTAKPGLRAVFCFSIYDDSGLGLEIVDKWPALQTIAALGMQITPLTGGANDYPQTVSWENVPDIKADLVVYLGGSGVYSDSTGPLPTNPTWALMPAVKAGQVVNIGSATGQFTYANYADIVGKLADAVNGARTGVGPH